MASLNRKAAIPGSIAARSIEERFEPTVSTIFTGQDRDGLVAAGEARR